MAIDSGRRKFVAALGIAMAWPLFARPDGMGYSDWDYFLERFEAAPERLVLSFDSGAGA